jgi:hypothetical protein
MKIGKAEKVHCHGSNLRTRGGQRLSSSYFFTEGRYPRERAHEERSAKGQGQRRWNQSFFRAKAKPEH